MLPNDDDLQDSIQQDYGLLHNAKPDQPIAPAGQGGFETLTVNPDLYSSLKPPARGIFAKWLRVLTRPSVATFTSEIPAANWGITILGVLIFAVLFFVFNMIMGIPPWNETLIGSLSHYFSIETSAINSFIVEVIALTIGSGLVYGLSKVSSRSTRNFAAQTYLYSLYTVPLAIISILLGRVPVLGSITSFAAFFYGLPLTYYMVQAIHRLNPDSARVVVLLIFLTPVFLFICFIMFFAFTFGGF